jgi:transposase
VTHESCNARIAELERQLTERDESIAEVKAALQKALARIAELEERLARNSSNSSKPPSSDTPEQRRNRPSGAPTGRKRGAQPGHKPHKRSLLPPEQVDHCQDVFPEDCEGCGAKLPSDDPSIDPDPWRHQVIELPEVKPSVGEWRCHSRECDECGHRTRAKLPHGIPQSMLGPRLTALIGLLTGGYHLSRRQAVTLLRDVLGIGISVGALSEAEERVADAVAPAVQEAVDFVRAQPVKHTDATGWARGKAARSLWTITTALVTVFFITADGTKGTVRRLLGRVRGWLVSDRAKQFGFWAITRRQVCWAHLMRKFAAFAGRDGKAGRIGRELHQCAELLFHYWHRVRDGTLPRTEFRRYMAVVRKNTEDLLERGKKLGDPGISGSCADILEHRPALWVFVDRQGIEPTNNLAERDLRPFVLWKKRSFGSQSDRGERFAERIMTVVHTLRKQQRHVLSYLYAACANALVNQAPPSLLPSSVSPPSPR